MDLQKWRREIGGNYRPISLTSEVFKLKRLILPMQHGFCRRRSCLIQLLEFLDQVYQEYDECKAVVFIDFDF